MPWKRMLAYITGSVNEDLLRRIEYLLEEYRSAVQLYVLEQELAGIIAAGCFLFEFRKQFR